MALTKTTDASLSTDESSVINIRKLLRNMPDLGDYGVTSSGVTDYGQEDFDAVFAGVLADGWKTVYAPIGNYRLAESIQMDDPITIIGDHKSSTVFKMYHSGAGFSATGLNGEVGGGLKRLSVVNDSGGAVTAAIILTASLSGESPDFFEIDGVNITGFSGATFSYGIIIDGNARTGAAPNGLVGVRDVRIKETDIFNCTVLNTDIRTGRGIFLSNIAHYQAGGSVTKISITGLSGQASNSVIINGSLLGDVATDYASNIRGLSNSISGVVISANTSDCLIGSVAGSITNNGSATKVLKTDGTFA